MTWETGQGHYPYQAVIDAYGDGGFRFAEMSHRGSVISLPSGMYAWEVEAPAQITLASLSRVLDQAEALDVLLIGTGHDIAAIAPDIRPAFREKGVIIEAVSTGSAVRTYNVLLAESRAVGAALISVEKAR
ncbi:Mth938-like domain-containing protein [Pelagibacterium mangrovi]|uniref:Mth938-like domain-containing protein n=1 Tax=Pelagibacterium mangrovi TaxID=3119828 RepID=UPI002FCC2FC4